MRYYQIAILAVFFLISCSENNNTQIETKEDVKDTLTSNLVRNYNFNVVVDVEHLQRNNEFNYKFLINKGWDYDENGKYINLPNEKLIRVVYNYRKDESKGYDHYNRVPVDSSFHSLNETELDSIYTLASSLFEIDSTNLVIDATVPTFNYDGEYIKISLTNDVEATVHSIEFSGMSSQRVGTKYKRLMDYLENIMDKEK